MRVEIDTERCEGNAVCVGMAPSLFVLDEDGIAVSVEDEVFPELESLAEHVIAECPRAALIRRD